MSKEELKVLQQQQAEIEARAIAIKEGLLGELATHVLAELDGVATVDEFCRHLRHASAPRSAPPIPREVNRSGNHPEEYVTPELIEQLKGFSMASPKPWQR